jgi:hypothetical protein
MTVCTTAPRRAPPGWSRAVRSRASEQQRALRVERALSQSLAELNGAGGWPA